MCKKFSKNQNTGCVVSGGIKPNPKLRSKTERIRSRNLGARKQREQR